LLTKSEQCSLEKRLDVYISVCKEYWLIYKISPR